MTAELSIVADNQRGPGYARLEFRGDVTDAARVIIRQLDGVKQKCLGPRGWQDEQSLLRPVSIETGTGQSAILLGPDVCDHLRPDELYDISLVQDGAASQPLGFGPVFWPSISKSGNHGGGGRIFGAAPPLQGGDTKRYVSIVDDPLDGGQPDEPPPREEEEQPATDDAGAGAADRPDKPHDARWPWLAGATFLLALAMAGASYVYWPEPWCGQIGQFCQPADLADGQEGEIAVPAAVMQRSEPTGAPPPALDGPDQWRAMISDPATPVEALFELGQRLRRDTDDSQRLDLGYEAIRRAADRDHPRSARWIADAHNRSLDEDTAGLGDSRSIEIALDHYRNAARLGDEEAATRRTDLCQWIRSRQFTEQSLRAIHGRECSE